MSETFTGYEQEAVRKHHVNMDDDNVTETVNTDAPTSAGDNIPSAHINNAVLFYVQYASGRSVLCHAVSFKSPNVQALFVKVHALFVKVHALFVKVHAQL